LLEIHIYFSYFSWRKIFGVAMASESVIDLMCPEIFPDEASDLRTLLPRKRGGEAIPRSGYRFSFLYPWWHVLAQKRLLA
jgi:hypothetical protein